MNSKIVKWVYCLLICGILILCSCGVPQNVDSAFTTQPSAVVSGNTGLIARPSPSSSSLYDDHQGKILDLVALSQDEKEALIPGEWMIFFPTPDQNWGFAFKKDFSYRYVDSSVRAIKERYRWTEGEWRLNGNDIEIQIISYTIRNRDAEEGPLGFQFPPESKLIQKAVQHEAWKKIGTLESLRTGLVFSGQEYPTRIKLHPLWFDKVQEEAVEYYQFTSE